MNTKRLISWVLIVSLGGFIFGFDTAVISGAEQAIERFWELNVFQHGLTVSIALIGTVIGAMLGGIPSDVIGRKRTLFWIAILFLISALGSALATDWYAFLIFRFIGGLGVGSSSVTAPMYIAEIAPASSRGRLVAMFQLNVVLGILMAFVSNYLLQDVGENAWRWMLGVQALPAFAFLLLVLIIPESPRWLIFRKGAVDEAERVFSMINPATAKAETVAVEKAHARIQNLSGVNLFSRQHRFPVLLAFLIAVFNQVSGINAVIYYAPRIFEMAGMGTSSALMSSIGIGLVNFLFTLLAINYIDRFGRKRLMLIGSVGLIITLAFVSRAFFVQDFRGYHVPAFLFLYIAFFAVSQGAICWVFISEIFPNEVRAKGQALGSSTHWLMAAIIAFSFPYMIEEIGPASSFLIFTLMMVVQLIFVLTIMPETKGTSLEDLEVKLEKIETTARKLELLKEKSSLK
jgi:sugar porter (SP) family MFS transporter